MPNGAVWEMLYGDSHRYNNNEDKRIDYLGMELLAIERRKEYLKALKKEMKTKYKNLRALAKNENYRQTFEKLYIETIKNISEELNKSNVEVKISNIIYPDRNKAKSNAILFDGNINLLNTKASLAWARYICDERKKEYLEIRDRTEPIIKEINKTENELNNLKSIKFIKKIILKKKVKKLWKSLGYDDETTEYKKEEWEQAKNNYDEQLTKYDKTKELLMNVEIVSLLNIVLDEISENTNMKLAEIILKGNDKYRNALGTLLDGYNLYEYERNFSEHNSVRNWDEEISWGQIIPREEIENFNEKLDAYVQNYVLKYLKENTKENTEIKNVSIKDISLNEELDFQK